jgi:hypothetical protein
MNGRENWIEVSRIRRFLAAARGAPIENAWPRILNKQAAIMAALGDRLGLDPKSRAALKLPTSPQRSKFASLLGAQDATI